MAILASLINPYGVALLAHVGGFFGNDAILRQTQEFMSPDFQTINGKLFLAAMLATFTALILSRRRPPWAWLFVVLGNVAMALISASATSSCSRSRRCPSWRCTSPPNGSGSPGSAARAKCSSGSTAACYGGFASAIVAAVFVAIALAAGSGCRGGGSSPTGSAKPLSRSRWSSAPGRNG